jgi:chromate transporter
MGTDRPTALVGQPATGSASEVLLAALKLGITCFGGPVAHLGYFRAEYVGRRRWLDDARFADLVGLCQFLPGPASSELGIAIGITRAGLLGGLAAWVGFTLPSAVALTLFALLVRGGDLANSGWVHGLQIVAVAVVAQAVWTMARTLAPDRPRATLAILAAIVMLLTQSPVAQVALIVAGAAIGWRLLTVERNDKAPAVAVSVGRKSALVAWILLIGLLVGLPILRRIIAAHWVALADSFYRTGALVFGGGHVVLPLLQSAVAAPGWVTTAQFTAGYGAAQAVPGPLFTFAAYLGAVEGPMPNGLAGAAIALIAIFLPAFLLVVGTLPLWEVLRSRPSVGNALRGVNAVVVGLLIAAFYNPIWTSAINHPADAALALAAWGLLAVGRLPPWLVVALAAGGAAAAGLH